jgi:hypothetical protein
MQLQWQQLKYARYPEQGTGARGSNRGAFSHKGATAEFSILTFIATALGVGLLTLLLLAHWSEKIAPGVHSEGSCDSSAAASSQPTGPEDRFGQTRFEPEQWGLHYQLKEIRDPRPVRIHALRVDFSCPQIVPRVIIAPDPDGDGPAEAELTLPQQLIENLPVLAFINTNPWDALPDAQGQRNRRWYPGQHVEILGLAASQGLLRSPFCPSTYSIWWDRQGQIHFGEEIPAGVVQEGIAGFLPLLREGRNCANPLDTQVEPRTAIGTEDNRTVVWLVVVDGRQPGFSEGMTYFELAAEMAALGCREAAALDGGGSSIMGILSADGQMQIVNSPSDRDFLGKPKIRPLPVILSIQMAARQNSSSLSAGPAR